ncbi:hypothetical protein ACFL4S_01670, partial [bacterium]
EEAVTLTQNFRFAVSIVLSCKDERSGSLYNIYKAINIEKLQNTISDRLKKHFITENRDIFNELPNKTDWIFVLYQWASNWMTFTGDNKKIVNDYIFQLIENDAKKFTRFLIERRYRGSDTLTFNLDDIKKVYNLKKFHELAEKFKDDNSLSIEEKDSINRFINLYTNNQPETKN